MEGVIEGLTLWFCASSYWQPVTALGSGPSEAVQEVPDFLLMIACSPIVKGIVMLSVGEGEVRT